MILKIGAFTLLFAFCCWHRSLAQSNRKISGVVTDTAKAAVPHVRVTIVTGKDTSSTSTDENGNFSFSRISADRFSLQIKAVGYNDFVADYTFADKEKSKQLGAIRLTMSSQALKEVVIKAKPVPIRYMQDTVEYNAAAYRVNEGDNVADLIKQFPDITVDGEYNTKVGDKPMTKLRVNGKDFFTNNVKDFIARLPAAIVSKIQVIDDFGDQANFTGIKVGEPIKMLNIVTKPGMNKGAFGGVSASAGTNDMVGGQAQVNLWNDNKQSSANLIANTANNGAGHSQTFMAGFSYNDKFGKNSFGGLGYNFGDNSAAFNSEQVTQSLNPGGNFTSDVKSAGNNRGANHNLHWNLNYNKDNRVTIQTNINATYNYSTNQSSSLVQQSGVLRQDVANNNGSNNTSPSVNGFIAISKKLRDLKDIISLNLSFSVNSTSNSQHISTNTFYYDQVTGNLLKDSLLKRDVDSKTNSRNFSLGFNYSVGLKRPKDTLARQSLNLNYNGTAGWSESRVTTNVFDNTTNRTFVVDSLSTLFNSITFNQTLGLNYNYSSNKMRYNIGLNTNASMLTNHDLILQQTIVNNTLNYSPNLNFSRTLSPGKILSVNYQGATRNPSLNQLQPIRNAQSLQNIMIGNPDLKASFSHNLSANFNYSQKSGRTLQVALNASTVQNEIVNDVILLPDTLNTLKQVTRYENINGNYQVNGNYLLLIPFKQNKYSLTYSGRVGFSNRIILFNHQQTSGKGFNLSQQLSGTLSLKKFRLNTQLSYTITNNNNSGASPYGLFQSQPIGVSQVSAPIFFRTETLGALLTGALNLEKLRVNANVNYSHSHNNAPVGQVVQSNNDINLNLGGQVTILKTYFTDFSTAKRINYGYAVPVPSPLLINIGAGKRFLKNQALSVAIRGTDLLGQGNSLMRSVSGNTIVDSRNIQPTRVFSINLSYNLSNFGGQNVRVNSY